MPIFPDGIDLRQAALLANEFVIGDIKSSGENNSKCSLLVSNLMEPSDVEQYLEDDFVCGFKPYVTLNPGCDSSSDIVEFLPEWALVLASERKLAVTLHIQKNAALSDPENISQIHEICSGYPGMKLILAHCGCSFNVYNTLKSVEHYTGIDNLYFDTSAVCEGMALVHMLKLFPAQKFMWGTDFPISVRHGRFVGLGDSVFSLQNNTVAGGRLPADINTLNHGLESLRALVWAIKECGLSDSEVEGIFYNNAAELLGINW